MEGCDEAAPVQAQAVHAAGPGEERGPENQREKESDMAKVGKGHHGSKERELGKEDRENHCELDRRKRPPRGHGT